jgi:hypothetical protein
MPSTPTKYDSKREMGGMTKQQAALARRAEKAVKAIRLYNLDPYTALLLTIRPTARIRKAERMKKAA